MQNHPHVIDSSTDERLEHVDEIDFPEDPCAFYFRKMGSDKRRTFLFRDIGEFAMLPFAFVAVNALSARTLARLCNLSGIVRKQTARPEAELQSRLIYEGVLGPMGDDIWADLRQKQIGQKLAHRLAIAREFGPRRLDPVIEFDGLESLRNELAQGKGAILWASRFTYYPILSKRALFQEGIAASAVSNSAHGYTASRLAELTINRIQVAAENKYLAKRLVFKDGEETKVQKDAITELKKGHPVIYTNSSTRGHRYVELSLGDAATVQMATGPISMSLRMGVPLFSLSVFELEPFTRYRAEITLLANEEQSAPNHKTPRLDYAAMANLARSSRNLILDGIRRHPDQYHFIN